METTANMQVHTLQQLTDNQYTKTQYNRYAAHFSVIVKKNDFKEWCKYFYDNDLVSENRLLAFLIQEVVTLPRQKRGRKSQKQLEEEAHERIERRSKVQVDELRMDDNLIVQCERGIMTVKG